MSKIVLEVSKIHETFVINGLCTIGQAKDILGYAAYTPIYRAIKAGEIRCAYVSLGHPSKTGLLFKKDVLAFRKKRAEKLKNKLKSLNDD